MGLIYRYSLISGRCTKSNILLDQTVNIHAFKYVFTMYKHSISHTNARIQNFFLGGGGGPRDILVFPVGVVAYFR